MMGIPFLQQIYQPLWSLNHTQSSVLFSPGESMYIWCFFALLLCCIPHGEGHYCLFKMNQWMQFITRCVHHLTIKTNVRASKVWKSSTRVGAGGEVGPEIGQPHRKVKFRTTDLLLWFALPLLWSGFRHTHTHTHKHTQLCHMYIQTHKYAHTRPHHTHTHIHCRHPLKSHKQQEHGSIH